MVYLVIHRDLIADLRKLSPDDHPKTYKWLASVDDIAAIKKIFHNARIENSGQGMRLSNFGFKILKSVYRYWDVDIEHPLTARQHLIFSRATPLPYYIEKASIATFDENAGVMLTMISGNIDLIGNIFSE